MLFQELFKVKWKFQNLGLGLDWIKKLYVYTIFFFTFTASQTQQGTPGHAEARRNVWGGG